MATLLTAGYEPVQMRVYPHLSAIDSAIWSAWLAMHAARVDEVWYDVWVGEHAEPDPSLSDQSRRIIQGTLAKRIDVVWRERKTFHVGEIKPYINSVALGQAIMYRDLFTHQYMNYKPVVTAVIGANVDPDVVPLLQANQIAVYKVPESVMGSI